VNRLENLLDALSHPEEGCPWDLKQTYQTISEDILEEAYELREALASGGRDEIEEEAGDLLFILFFLGRLLTKGGLGLGIKEAADRAVDKMVSRHPHVFADAERLHSAGEVLTRWHQIKRAEKKERGVLDSVPLALPALARCHRLGSKAGKAGFDWENASQVREKLDEELRELDQEIAKGNPRENREKLEWELGDALAALANLSRHLGLSPEKALDAHNRRFIRRFSQMEAELKSRGKDFPDYGPSELEELWRKAKSR
jgi:MazG family protein